MNRCACALPMELLQAAFWSLDPQRTVTKFAHFAKLEPDSAQAQRFIALEDWANEGEPLPWHAARELIEDLFGDDMPGNGRWRVAGQTVSDLVPAPALHLTAAQDRITPAASAPRGEAVRIGAGHVGMVVGSKRRALHQELKRFLDPACR
jgi:polyhydroxyalkanoate synthase